MFIKSILYHCIHPLHLFHKKPLYLPTALFPFYYIGNKPFVCLSRNQSGKIISEASKNLEIVYEQKSPHLNINCCNIVYQLLHFTMIAVGIAIKNSNLRIQPRFIFLFLTV